MEQNENAGMSLDALLEASLDDIADLPVFEVPTPGYYRLGLTIDKKKINDKEAVEFTFTVKETMEVADPSATPPKTGDVFSTACMVGNKYGLAAFKEVAAPVMVALGTTRYGDILNGQVRDMEVFATVKHRRDKNDPDKVYAKVSNVTPA